jgi:hypothetical protein
MAEENPSNTKELHEWAVALMEDGESRRNPYDGLLWENLATYVGDFWVSWDPHSRRLSEPVRKPKHRVRLPINLAQPVVRTEVAKLTKNRPITDVVPKSNDNKDLNSAKVGDKMLNRYAEREFHLAKVRRQMLNWVCIGGSGAIFVDYDESAEDPIEIYEVNDKPVFDERVIKAYQKRERKKKGMPTKLKRNKIPQGQIAVKALGPHQLIWDFSSIEPEDAWWQIVTEIYDTNIVEKRWGTKVDGEDDAEPGVIERRLLHRFDLTQKLTPHSPKAQQLVKIYRLFVKPGHPFFPKGAEIVFTKNKLIASHDFPFRHGALPATVMGHIPLPTSQYDMSVLQQVRGPVLELSKTESQMIENRNQVANPPWLIPIQTRVDENDIQNKPGLRLKYNHVPNVPPPSPVQMPDMPSYVKELPGLLREHIQDISGQGETSQGRVPAGARSGVAIAYLQEEDDTRLGPTVTAFEETMERANWQVLQVMAEKYDIPRTVRIYRKHSEPEVFDFKGEMLDGCAGVEVQAGSALPRSKAAKQQFILDLWDRRLEQDPRKVRKMLELSEGEPDEWERDVEQAERENRKLEKGIEVKVEDWFNHNAHLYSHHQYMKTGDFEELPEETQAMYVQHCKEHEQALKQQKTEIAMLQQMGGEGQSEIPGMGSAEAGGNGQQRPEGAPEQFTGESPRSLLDDAPA